MEDVRSFGGGSGLAAASALGAALLFTFGLRALYLDQPLVENYVGRQIPTAMVARNLDRGSGFLRPQLETAPFPNYFVVEPPVFELVVVALKRITQIDVPEAGRLVSAMLSALAAWGLYLLVRARERRRTALLAVLIFAVFPLTIRYGRAFQPDASMLGATVAGLACWDRSLRSQSTSWRIAGWCSLAAGFAMKITSAFLLVPLMYIILRRGRRRDLVSAFATVVPALLWYAWALHLIGQGTGSQAAADNRSIWLTVVGLGALFNLATLKTVAWSLLVRAFTPLGAALAVYGLQKRSGADHADDTFWWVWAGAAFTAMAFLANKLHHEYYWLPLAPVVAVGVARGVDRLAANQNKVALAVVAALAVLCVFQTRKTWQTPTEWRGLNDAARAVAEVVPPRAWVAAPEALLFQADRRGCRMEWTPDAAQRAAKEWLTGPRVESPMELIDYYRATGARYFADLACHDPLSSRKGLHDAVRERYKVIVDSPDVLIADLSNSGTQWNAN